jgi:hypothetical protein
MYVLECRSCNIGGLWGSSCTRGTGSCWAPTKLARGGTSYFTHPPWTFWLILLFEQFAMSTLSLVEVFYMHYLWSLVKEIYQSKIMFKRSSRLREIILSEFERIYDQHLDKFKLFHGVNRWDGWVDGSSYRSPSYTTAASNKLQPGARLCFVRIQK